MWGFYFELMYWEYVIAKMHMAQQRDSFYVPKSTFINKALPLRKAMRSVNRNR